MNCVFCMFWHLERGQRREFRVELNVKNAVSTPEPFLLFFQRSTFFQLLRPILYFNYRWELSHYILA